MLIRIILWIFIILGGILSSLYLDYNIIHIHVNLVWHIILFVIGFLLLRIILYTSAYTGRVLKKLGKKGKVPKFETNRLIKEDIYSCMRHPMHLGLLLLPESVGFMMGSPSFILIVGPIIMVLMIMMIKLFEEKEAERKFGEEYRKYKKEVPMFSLSPHCLKYFFRKEK